ncbi:MAG TPA: hypothetical protein QGF05_14740 [Dehalococcoidia bacterium]|nr:hypothetical protein [Dehalococcoidia bacterium]
MEGMRFGKIVGEESVDVGELLREMFEAEGTGAVGKGTGSATIGAGGAADAKVDATGVEGVDEGEGFGHFEGRVVRQHDAAGADADALGASGDLGDQDLGGGAGEGSGVVVLGQPIAGVTESVGGLGKFKGLGQGLLDSVPLANRNLIENSELHVVPPGRR